MDNAGELSEALGVPTEILPHLSALLTDLWDLGSWPDEIVEVLRPLKLPERSTNVFDLGCGKGAVTIPMARELGFHVRRKTEQIAKRARELARQHPGIADSLWRYVQWAKEENDTLETETIPAIWLLRRS